MSTATQEAPKKKKRTNRYEAKLAVKFKNLSVGDEITTLGFSVSRDQCSIDFAEQSFCGKRVKVRLLAGAGADPSQGILWDDVQHDVEGTANIKKFSVTPKLISAGCAFEITAVTMDGVMELTKFAKREGVLLIVKVLGEAKDDAKDEGDEEDDEDKE